VGQGVSIRGAARMWGCSYYTARKRLLAGEIPPAIVEGAEGPQFPDLKEFPKDTDGTWGKLIGFQAELRRWDIQQSAATVDLHNVDGPIGIAIRGDWHLGSESTDYETFKAHLDLIDTTPDLYTAELGDLIDGYVKPNMPTGHHEAMVRVRFQRHLVWDACKRLSGRVLCTVSGQHDHWGVHQADFDPVEWVSHDIEVPYLGHGGLLTLHVGEQTYTMHIRHKGRFRSSANITHGIKQHWRFVEDADIGCHADMHIPAIEHVHWKGEHRLAIRPGSYKPTDDYAQAGDFGTSPAVMPCLILWPDRKRMQAWWTLEEGAEYLRGLRQ